MKLEDGFFALWNDVPPVMAEEFQAMHTRDHIVEHLRHLGPDGFRWARRYTLEHGTLPRFFTWYGMRSLCPLVDPLFADRRPVESDWFRSIRPQYRDRIGHHCQVVATSGGGIGGSIAAVVAPFSLDVADDGVVATLRSCMASLTDREAITGAHLGLVDWAVPSRAGGPLPSKPEGSGAVAVAIVESFSAFGLSRELTGVLRKLSSCGLDTPVAETGIYRLSYALDYDSISAARYSKRLR